MFWNEQDREDYRRQQKKLNLEKMGLLFMGGLGYYFGGITLAILLGLYSVAYSLFEIQKQLNYQNFMKEKQIGLHDYTNP